MKKICVFFLALAVFLLPEMVYAANATPQAVNMPHVYIVFGVLFVAAVLFFYGMDSPGRHLHSRSLCTFHAWRHHRQGGMGQLRRHQHPDHRGPVHAGRGNLRHGFCPTSGNLDHQQGRGQRNPPAGLSILLIAFMSAFLNNAGVTGHHPAHAHFHRPQGPLVPLAHLAAPRPHAASFGGCISLVGAGSKSWLG